MQQLLSQALASPDILAEWLLREVVFLFALVRTQ